MTARLESGPAATQVTDASAAPRLIVINQYVGPSFCDWLARLAAIHGPVELWSGNAPTEVSAGVVVRRLAPYDNASVTRRLVTWGRFTLAATWLLLRQGGQTPLFVVTNPPFMLLAARVLKALQGRSYGLLEWDIYPQILAAMGLAGPKNPLFRLWHFGHASALRAADLTVTIGDDMAHVLRQMADDTSLSVTVAPNWVDTDWLKPLPSEENPFVQEHELQGKVVVLYSGNLGATHAIETILEVARLMSDEDRLCFLIIGEGSKRGLVESAIARGEAPTLRLLPLQPAARLPQTLSSGHIGIVTLGKGYEGLSMPSKIYALMAAGNAILGISQPANALVDTINRHGCGANFSPDDPLAIAAWMRSLLADSAALARLQANSRQAAVTEYSVAHCTALLNSVVSTALLRKNEAKVA